jgi:hypothetical protein
VRVSLRGDTGHLELTTARQSGQSEHTDLAVLVSKTWHTGLVASVDGCR